MAAPDVDAGEFQTKYAKSVNLSCTQATLYTSESDRALLLSHRIHGFMRLGETAHPPPVFDGIDTVNITPIDPSLLGHSYYGNQPVLLQDLRALVELGDPPSDRKWLIKMIRDANASAWRFRPELATRASQLAR
jgi:esterase/lipase superfamily enzyme